jgi:hypothetical protein
MKQIPVRSVNGVTFVKSLSVLIEGGANAINTSDLDRAEAELANFSNWRDLVRRPRKKRGDLEHVWK